MHDNIPPTLLNNYKHRLGAESFHTRIAFENGSLPFPPRAFRRQNLFGPLTRVTIATCRLLLRLSGLSGIGRAQCHAPVIVENTISLPHLPTSFEGFRILHLSDLHIDLAPSFIDSLIPLLQPLQYDLCIMTGDYRNHTYGSCTPSIIGMQNLITHLHQPLLAILGNHDRLCMVEPLEAAGCRVLLNEHFNLTKGADTITFIGVDDPCVVGTHDITHALKHCTNSPIKLLLSHSPAIYPDANDHAIDYIFCGHTHGGQICLPGPYIPVPNDPSPRSLPRGPWEKNNLHGYTSPGTGSCGIAARFNCPPEITIHTLTR